MNIKRCSRLRRLTPPSILTLMEKKKAFREEERLRAHQLTPNPLKAILTVRLKKEFSGYCVAFHWDHLTEQEFDAAVAAEMEEVGSGRAVIDAAAQNKWQAKRKGQAQ